MKQNQLDLRGTGKLELANAWQSRPKCFMPKQKKRLEYGQNKKMKFITDLTLQQINLDCSSV